MGQKVHPKSFRLITTQKHLSNWYSSKKFYPLLLKEDFFIRTTIEKLFEKFLTISSIKISRTSSTLDLKNYANVCVSCLFPREKEIFKKWHTHLETIIKSSKNFRLSKKIRRKYFQLVNKNVKGFSKIFLGRLVKQFKKLLKQKYSRSISFSFHFLQNKFEDATLIAKFIGELLEKRVPFRRIINIVIKKTLLTSIKGIKIQISGRLNGNDIARTEWKREGKISLHTLESDLEYAQYSQKSVYGIFGIKVWILK